MLDPMPEIVQGDARALDLPDASVDLIVTSPPYFGLRDYGTAGQLGVEPTPAEYIAALIECTREMVRVLKPSGSIFVNLGDKYNSAASNHQTGALKSSAKRDEAQMSGRVTGGRGRTSSAVPVKSLQLLPERYRIAAVDELGLIVRAVLIWSKPNGLPESATDRVRRSHEDWVHLTKSPRYFASVDEIREPRKLPGSVWSIPTQPLRVPAELGVDHFAAFPMEWPRRLILGWSPVGGTVLDPCGGTGTTALVAALNGRRGISVDLSADYCRLAHWRARDPKQRAKAAGSARQVDTLLSVAPVVVGTEVCVAAPVADAPGLARAGQERADVGLPVAVDHGRITGADDLLAHAPTVARAPRPTEEGAA